MSLNVAASHTTQEPPYNGSAGATIVQFPRRPLARIPQEMFVLGGILILLQILDGVLTGFGMHLFGTDREGNMIIRSLMDSLGYIPALVLAKLFAITIVVGLCFLSKQVRWIGTALKTMIALYFFAAVLPWSAILISQLA